MSVTLRLIALGGEHSARTRPSVIIAGAVEMLCTGCGACPGTWLLYAYELGTPPVVVGGMPRGAASAASPLCGLGTDCS